MIGSERPEGCLLPSRTIGSSTRANSVSREVVRFALTAARRAMMSPATTLLSHTRAKPLDVRTIAARYIPDLHARGMSDRMKTATEKRARERALRISQLALRKGRPHGKVYEQGKKGRHGKACRQEKNPIRVGRGHGDCDLTWNFFQFAETPCTAKIGLRKSACRRAA